MSKWELPQVDLQEYADNIRKTFEIEEDMKIDYSAIAAIPTEIERRRALFKYFIPDVFAPGKYDRRADLIDGGIYYLAHLERKGNQSIVLHLWTKRLNISKTFNESDLEEGPYGYTAYHPIWHILGNPNNPGFFVPRIVQYIRSFKGRKRKLDINDYSLIFFSIFHSVPFKAINTKMLRFLRLLNSEFEKRPLIESINLKDYMKVHGFGNVRSFLAQVNRIGVHIHSVFERSTFGLDTYLFCCPYPHHVQMRFHNGSVIQAFLTGGKEYIQELQTNIPTNMNWKLLYRKFPPQTKCYRTIKLRVPHQYFLKYFDTDQQKWLIPWSAIIKEWDNFIKTLEQTDIPMELDYQDFEPTEDLLKVCNLLELNGNYKNNFIHRKTKIPIEQIEKIRSELDMGALVLRALMLYHSNLIDNITITLPGNEQWKYKLLLKLGEVVPYHNIYLLEDHVNSESLLRGNYLLVPEDGIYFLKTFAQVFHGLIDYTLHKWVLRFKFTRSWFQDCYDTETESWIWDPNDYQISPISFNKI